MVRSFCSIALALQSSQIFLFLHPLHLFNLLMVRLHLQQLSHHSLKFQIYLEKISVEQLSCLLPNLHERLRFAFAHYDVVINCTT